MKSHVFSEYLRFKSTKFNKIIRIGLNYILSGEFIPINSNPQFKIFFTA